MERAQREREQYNKGLQRERYRKVLAHCSVYYNEREKKLINDALKYADGKIVLELGSLIWRGWLESVNIVPKQLHCINISEKELNKGIEAAKDTIIQPQFHLMDANQLLFKDDTFDVVFGGAILHHLDFITALDEIQRVLKPGGLIVFVEPLDNNPVAKIVRLLTPKARTKDEYPFRFEQLYEMEKRFDGQVYYSEFISVPLGVISGLLFKQPRNFLTSFGYKFDRALETLIPPIRYYYRRVLFIAHNK